MKVSTMHQAIFLKLNPLLCMTKSKTLTFQYGYMRASYFSFHFLGY